MIVDEIYQRIANIINEAITEDWKEATALLKRVKKVVGFTGSYLDANGISKNLEAKFGFFDAKAIHELHQITTEGGKNRWNRLKFTLYPTGKFELDFIWDQDYDDELSRINKQLNK